MEHEPFSPAAFLYNIYSALQKALDPGFKPAKSRIFHYTSTEVLNKILANGCFRATNIYYLNDSKEYLQGLDCLKEIVAKAEPSNAEIISCLEELRSASCNAWEGLYTISFCTKEDNLQNWITYARESGVCIELDADIMARGPEDMAELGEQYLVLVQKNSDQHPVNAISCGSCLHVINYGATNLKMEHLERAFRDCQAPRLGEESTEYWKNHRESLKRFLQLTASFFKVSGFDGEHEVRLSLFPQAGDFTDENAEVEIQYFRMSNGVLRPFIDVFFMELPGKSCGCPISAITIGPGGHQQVVFNSVVHRIKYGKCSLWQYGPKKKAVFLKNYLILCQKYIKDLLTQEYGGPDPDLEKDILTYLQNEWAFRAGYIVTSLNADSLVLELAKGKNIDRPEPSASKKFQSLLNRIAASYYFSSNGILVKKSAIPYIF